MITCSDGVFRLSTENSSYWFRITPFRHLEHIHYGARLPDDQPVESLLWKRTAVTGSAVLYDDSDETYCLDQIPLEWAGIGSGDYRQTPFEARMPDGTFASDFHYVSHTITDGTVPLSSLPSAYGEADCCQTLILLLLDEHSHAELQLVYTVFEKTNVISRRAVITNRNSLPMTLRRIMSLSLDLPNQNDTMVTFDGAWIREAHRHDRRLEIGQYAIGSTTGASSNRSNPGFLLAEEHACESHGNVYGFNLVYSGNHIGLCELSVQGLVRIQIGIHPQGFEWTLQEGESFETPEAVMTFSANGFNGLSANFHDFIGAHIVRGDWKGRERPVLLNNWEATFFRFTRGKLLRMARQAKRLGVELFVLDDGWFGKRNHDRAGLGDYTVNRKKLPRGMRSFANEIRALGLSFGLWFEPEMVNEDSDLFRAHPEYAVRIPGKPPTHGRHQLVLDLCNPEVRDYIVKNVSAILDDAGISYVKWDMNRHISDAYSACLPEQGRFYHAYLLGLYDVLARIFRPRPGILLESCSSGGNRFDLGMLCFSPQIWASDNTDPVERLKIQGGLSYLYPLSCMGAHVSCSPHQQTLRISPLSTRFNVASFGCLGYELDLKYLTPTEKREVKAQIAFYKAHRKTLQYGRFTRFDAIKHNKVHWQCANADSGEVVAGFFQTECAAAEGNDRLPLTGLLPDAVYAVRTKPQRIPIGRFGALVKHILPFELNPNGWILRFANRHFSLNDCEECYTATGRTLMQGISLNNQFIGTGYNTETRLLGDFGSNLYTVEKQS